jgi:two-component system nitrogen regulation response regulator GlnG
VRELANAVQKALIFNRGGPVSREDFARVSGIAPDQKPDLPEDTIRAWLRQYLTSQEGAGTFDSAMDQFSAMLITEALNLNGGNRSRSAKMLGLSRPTLIAKIEKHRIRFETSAISEE